mgnify:FL=1
MYIVDCVRTPVGRRGGLLSETHPVTMLSEVLDELVHRAGVDKAQVEDVICGCVTPLGEQGANVGRLAALKAGFPITTPGVQLNRMCGSAQQSIHFACQAILAGDMDCVIACGVESMSRVPMGSDSGCLTSGKLDGDCDVPFKLLHQGVSAEMIAEEFNITRDEVDTYAVRSHELAFHATEAEVFASQIKPMEVVTKDGKKVMMTKDEGIRYPTSTEQLGKLKTIFKKDGVVTAGNASQISDGAAAVLLVSGRKARELGLTKRAQVVTRVVVGSDPELMLTGPIPATKKALEKSGLDLSEISVFEINEAFATVVLAWQKELQVPWEKINPNGGAIAHGHPLGATGCILMTKLVNELERSGARYGLQTMCIGHGMATCTIIENCSAVAKL